MERPPLWPFAVGLVAWGGAATVVAVYDVWWPLILAGVLSLGPGLLVGGMVLFTSRARRDAAAALEPTAPTDGNGRSESRSEPIAEPPKTRASGARTNAKNAGRRRGGAAVLLAFLALGSTEGCDKIERARAERRAREAGEAAGGGEAAPTTATTPTPATPTTGTTVPPSPAVDVALDAALARAITPPSPGEATWRVDPFVAALVFERVRSGVAPTFTQLAAPIPEGPPAGFRVGDITEGSLLHRLGLRTGDVIEALGGVVLTDASRIGFALDGAENKVDVTVFRDGMSIVQSYRLTNALAWTGLLASFTGDPASVVVDAVPPTPEPSAGTPTPGEPAAVPGTVPTTPRPSSGASTPTVPKPTPGGGGGGGSTPGGGGGGPTPGSGGGTSPSDPVRCESASKCTITQAYFDKMVASPSAMQSQATIVPAIQNDVHSGYKLKSIKAGSSVAKLGFRAGDKITHINGRDLTDELQAAQLYMGLSGTKVFKIRYERGGSSQVKTVVVD
jgi:hypothetical protein